MATYTQNYSLHQWEDTDDFLRTDFNEDFAKIDTGLASLKTNIATNGYNIYNLMLQNYYESKYTGYKQGLLFDGFTEEDENTILSDSVRLSNDELDLYGVMQSSPKWTSTANSYSNYTYALSTATVTVTAPAYLVGFTFSVGSGNSSEVGQAVCYVNNVAIETISIPYSSRSGTDLSATLSTPVYVEAGDTVKFTLASFICAIVFYGSDSTTVSGTMNFTPLSGTTGTVTRTESISTPWSQAHLWVRYLGGGITPTLNGSVLPLSQTTQAITLQGDTCTEGYWVGGEGEDTLTLILQLDLNEDSDITVYDYGLLLL